jgi:dihydroflavonol-4-reductase
MSKTLITGATGFIGSQVAEALCAKGREIRVLVRRDKYLENLAGLKFEIARGDILDIESLRKAMQGCDRVFHVAAVYEMWTLDPDIMIRTNVEGTKNVLQAARELGIERVVYTSSVAAIGIRDDGIPSDETVEWNLKWINDPYVESKFNAMKAAEVFIKDGLDVVIVHPAAPIGVGDIKPTPTGQMIVDFLNGKTPVYFKGGFDLVDVEDVAIGHLLAEEKGRKGESYILGGTNIYLKDMYRMLSEISGVTAPSLFLPHQIDLFASWVLTKTADYITRKPPLITLGGCRMIKLPPFYDHSKAKRELGYNPQPLRETMEKAIRYFYQRGYTKKR